MRSDGSFMLGLIRSCDAREPRKDPTGSGGTRPRATSHPRFAGRDNRHGLLPWPTPEVANRAPRVTLDTVSGPQSAFCVGRHAFDGTIDATRVRCHAPRD